MSPQEERVKARIIHDLSVLEKMLAVETKLRDKLVELGRPAGFKTQKMKFFERQIASRRKELDDFECSK